MAEKKKPAKKGQTKTPPDNTRQTDFPWLSDPELFGGWDPNSPSAKVRGLLQQAHDEPDEDRRAALAHEVLAIDLDCADAYTLLAEDAPTRKLALRFYLLAVAAGERSLGAEIFQRDVGRFWGIPKTRPYMQARLGLAHALWTVGRHEEAVQHLEEMLRLNPNDNQGIRYTLASFLLFLDRDPELASLLQRFPDENSAAWAYTRALLDFRRHGDTPESRQLLTDARNTNIHVPAYLLGEKMPQSSPGYYVPGEESEAMQYVGGFTAGWKYTLGALPWLRENVKGKKSPDGKPRARGPLRVVKKWLHDRLEQKDDVWQADVRPLPQWIVLKGVKTRMWLVLVANRSHPMVLSYHIAEEEPDASGLWDSLVQAMQNPLSEEPHRPAELHVRADERWESLRPHFEEIGIELSLEEELDLLDEMFKDMAEQVCGKTDPGLLDMPGMTSAQVGSFFEAAAGFFTSAPWKKLGYESAIKIECRQFESGPWYAVLMGQSGLLQGIALYEDLETLESLWAGDFDDEDSARQSVALTLLYGEDVDLSVADVDAAKEHGWKVARSDAYPAVFRKERGLSMRPPLTWELELMEGCLRALPDFISRHAKDERAKETLTVPTATRRLEMELSWVVVGE